MVAIPSQKLVAIALGVSILLAAIGASHFIGFNSSPSAAPVGFYWRTAPRPERGKLVEVCLPEEVARFGIERGYIGYGSCPGHAESLGKTVLGMPGDIVTLDPATVLKTDHLGRPIDHFPFGKYRVKPGEVWLSGTARNSFDSRYFGGVPISNVRANLSPLLTWGGR
jgi:conjugative transfer signal peptidase TraF